jgi:uncharacterized protein YjbJ (UPF0337 family)
MASSTRDKLEGKGKQVAGKAKEQTSELLNDRQTAAEGRGEQTAGKVQETKGKVKGKAKDLIDKV